MQHCRATRLAGAAIVLACALFLSAWGYCWNAGNIRAMDARTAVITATHSSKATERRQAATIVANDAVTMIQCLLEVEAMGGEPAEHARHMLNSLREMCR